jgi:hypothetical protein
MNLTTKDHKRYQMVPVPPGLMQYHVKQESINDFNIEELKIKNTSFTEGFEFETHSYENLQRLIPFTTTGKKNKDDWKPRIEAVPAQPNLNVSFTTSQPPLCLRPVSAFRHGSGRLAVMPPVSTVLSKDKYMRPGL